MDLSERDWAHVDERAQDFTGREWVFERLRAFLASDARLFVVVAPPGTGKTAIAARLAQASAGHLPDAATLPVPVGTFAAAAFCQAGQVSLLEVAQDLADQLSSALDGFADEQKATVAPTVDVSDVEVTTGDVTGGRVIGVHIDLARLGPERAFADGLAVPLRRLSERPSFRPPVLLVDSLDEAYVSPVAQKLPSLLAGMTGARLVMTTRDDPRVLAAIGLEAAVAGGGAVRVHLLDDVPPDVDEIADYVTGRLAGHAPDEAIAILANRISAAAAGNFLYAHHVVPGLLAGSVLAGVDAASAADVPFPTGGLPGIYRDFLGRELAGDEERWSREVRPILAPLAVALGDGLDTLQLAAVASTIGGRPVTRSVARDVTRLTGGFLKGSQPDGPFRVYHRSFADFLLDAGQNPDWPIDAAETHGAIVDALLRRDAAGNTNPSAVESYARTNLAEHAAAAGRLDDLVTDPGFLIVADTDRLLPLVGNVTSPAAREAAEVFRLASADLRGRIDDERGSYLELAARMRGAGDIGDRIAALMPDRAWSVPRARWRTPASHVRLTGHQGAVTSVAITTVDDRPVAFSGGADGTLRVWDLRDLVQLGEPLEGHEDGVWSVAAGMVGGRPIAVSGGSDATVRIWDLATRERLGEPLLGHDVHVRSVVLGAVDGRPLVVSAGADGIRVWDPDARSPLGEPLLTPSGAIQDLAMATTQEGSIVVAACADQAVRAWAIVKDGTFSKHGDPLSDGPTFPYAIPIPCAAVGELDGRLVAVSGNHRGELRLWDLRTMASVGEPVGGHDDRGVLAVVIGVVADRPVAASAGRDGIRIWDLRTMSPLGDPLVGHEGGPTCVGIGEVDGRPIAISGGRAGTVRVWDLVLDAPSGRQATEDAGRVDSVIVSEVEDRPVAVTVGDGRLRTWDLETLDPRGDPIESEAGSFHTVAAGAVDDRRVAFATAGWPPVMQVRDVATLEQLGELVDDEGGSGDVIASYVAEDRPIAVSGDDRGLLRLWDLRTWERVGDPIQAHDGRVLAVEACDVDGRTVIVSGGDDEVIRVWDVAAEEPEGKEPGGRIGRISCLAVGSVDGRPVVVRGGHDNAIRVWDLRTLEPVETPLRGHAEDVIAVAIGELAGRPVIVSAGDDRTVRIWDLRSWSQAAQLSLPKLTGLALAPPDRIVGSASSGLIVIRVAHLPVATTASPPA